MTTIAVVIPSVGRPAELAKCLEGVGRQTRLPDVVIVVTQAEDIATLDLARTCGARTAIVPRRGLAQAIQTGLEAAGEVGADIACYTDDDAIPRKDWVQRIAAAFRENPSAGIICGRDNINGVEPAESQRIPVGVITNGKIVGNHHTGTGAPRLVDHAKGANMAVRVADGRGIPLASLVYGQGAQAGNELILSLAFKAKGWSCLYSPEIQVDHYPAPRAEMDDRFTFSYEKTFERAYNRTLGIAAFSPLATQTAYVLRSIAVGDRANPGLVACFYWLKADRRLAWTRYRVTLTAIATALNAGRRVRSTFFNTPVTTAAE